MRIILWRYSEILFSPRSAKQTSIGISKKKNRKNASTRIKPDAYGSPATANASAMTTEASHITILFIIMSRAPQNNITRRVYIITRWDRLDCNYMIQVHCKTAVTLATYERRRTYRSKRVLGHSLTGPLQD